MSAETVDSTKRDVVYVSSVEAGSFLGEECGVVGVFSQNGNATTTARLAIAQLQHRGQEAAGESTWRPDGSIQTHVGLGLVPSVLTSTVLDSLGPSTHAIAHCRYTTSDKGNLYNAQPVMVSYGGHSVSVAHNGNLFDTRWYDDIDIPIKTPGTSDSNKLAAYILWHRMNGLSSWSDSIETSLTRVQKSGAVSAVILTDDGSIYGVKDPYGIRPLCIAEADDGLIVASESVAPDMMKARYRRELKPGEICHIDQHGNLETYFYGTPQFPRQCTLERLYFSRPDSWDALIRMRQGREQAGVFVAQRMIQQGIHPTVVVPIYDSGLPASNGIARGLGVPSEDALTTSHYVGRTFIMPGDENRQSAVNGKHHVTPEGIQGEDVVAGDDSLVRGNTARPIMKALEEAGVTKKRLALTAPPVVHPCDLGVDTPTKAELLASKYDGMSLEDTERIIAEDIGADSVTYLPIENVASAFHSNKELMCWHCFGGPHPIRDEHVLFRYKERPIQGRPKVAVFISGNGTNLENILLGVEQGHIAAEIVQVISNHSNAGGVAIAEHHHIPVDTVPSKGLLKDIQRRAEYMRSLIHVAKKHTPDIIVFAGWNIILDDQFLSWMRDSEIIGINLHPAILPEGNEPTTLTTRGKIPVLRGSHAIEEAYTQNLPVSGVTVHQLLPGMEFDTGPVILREEVRHQRDESFEEWERRIHKAEYRVLPTALKRVLHVLQHNINVSNGDFPW